MRRMWLTLGIAAAAFGAGLGLTGALAGPTGGLGFEGFNGSDDAYIVRLRTPPRQPGKNHVVYVAGRGGEEGFTLPEDTIWRRKATKQVIVFRIDALAQWDGSTWLPCAPAVCIVPRSLYREQAVKLLQCFPENCRNGRDDDCDGAVDGADSDCK